VGCKRTPYFPNLKVRRGIKNNLTGKQEPWFLLILPSTKVWGFAAGFPKLWSFTISPQFSPVKSTHCLPLKKKFI